MHELTFLETGYLMGLLALSVVLPMQLSFRNPQDASVRRACLRTVCIGQGVLVVAGVLVLLSGWIAPFAAAAGLVNCLASLIVLRHQSQVAQPVQVRR